MITVSDLIKILQQLDQNTPLSFIGRTYDGTYGHIAKVVIYEHGQRVYDDGLPHNFYEAPYNVQQLRENAVIELWEIWAGMKET